MKKPYMQFSKRVVIAVMITVTLMCVFSLVMCMVKNDTDGLVDIYKAYLNFAVIVFAAYSGNSAIEKVATKYFDIRNGTTSSSDSEESESNG